MATLHPTTAAPHNHRPTTMAPYGPTTMANRLLSTMPKHRPTTISPHHHHPITMVPNRPTTMVPHQPSIMATLHGSPLTNNDHRQLPNTYGLGSTGNYDSDIYGVLSPNNVCQPMINPIQHPGNDYSIAAGNNYSVLPVADHRAPSVLSHLGLPTNMNTTRVSDIVRNPHLNQDHAHGTNVYNYAATPGSADPHASADLSHVAPAAQGHLIAPGGQIANYNNNPNCNLGSSGYLTSSHHAPAMLPVDPASYTSVFEDGLNPGNEFHELQSRFAANHTDDAGSLVLASNTSLSATFGNAAENSSLGAPVGPTSLDVGSNGQMLDVKVDVRMDEQGDQGGLAEVSEAHEGQSCDAYNAVGPLLIDDFLVW
ncbi:hypothetical protein PGTUg99_011726 [Puccinia graminis f. sp. tritici]|uniref:Uncharacterized protein n=1 Tax=Puccinia graminis f. sp. tritici TaxID=56615 RepID=A0A5B0S0X3_PUCGR|nr:hypothetical protein PGTUg99_011726 [Puccinia graminis f. sp. tritici]